MKFKFAFSDTRIDSVPHRLVQVLATISATVVMGSAAARASDFASFAGDVRDASGFAISNNVDVPDGFERVTCESVDQDIRFDLYLQLGSDPKESPKALGLIALDPNVAESRAEIARFIAAEGLLSNVGSVITGYVDLQNPHTARRGERIGGTKLGALRSLTLDLDIDFSIAPSASKGKTYSGQVVYFKRNGEEHVQDIDCGRHR